MRCILLKTVVLLAVAIGAGFAHSKLTKHPPDLHFVPQNPAAAPTGAAPATGTTTATGVTQGPKPEVDDGVHISVARAKEFYDLPPSNPKKPIFIDARNHDDYKDGHVPGSMWIDKKYFDGAAPKKVTDYLPGMSVVIYCHGADCSDSEAVAKRLQSLNRGIGPMYIIKDGFPGWVKAGYPVDKGEEVGF